MSIKIQTYNVPPEVGDLVIHEHESRFFTNKKYYLGIVTKKLAFKGRLKQFTKQFEVHWFNCDIVFPEHKWKATNQHYAKVFDVFVEE